MSTLVTLGFTGVIAPNNPNPEEEWTHHILSGMEAYIKPEVLNFLNFLKETENEILNIVWASTWNVLTEDFHDASFHSIPDFPHLKIEHGAEDKVKEIIDVSQDYSKVIVVDSDIRVGMGIRMNDPQSDKYIMVRPYAENGLNDSNIRTIKRFLPILNDA